jgi:hypothetical protein
MLSVIVKQHTTLSCLANQLLFSIGVRVYYTQAGEVVSVAVRDTVSNVERTYCTYYVYARMHRR